MKIQRYSNNLKNIKVIFCGKDLFISSYNYTKEYLKNNQEISIKQCNNTNLDINLQGM